MSVKIPPSPPTIGPPFADEEPTTQIATNKRFLFNSDFQTFLLLKAHPQLALQPPHSLKQAVSSYSQLAKPGCKKSREFSRVLLWHKYKHKVWHKYKHKIWHKYKHKIWHKQKCCVWICCMRGWVQNQLRILWCLHFRDTLVNLPNTDMQYCELHWHVRVQCNSVKWWVGCQMITRKVASWLIACKCNLGIRKALTNTNTIQIQYKCKYKTKTKTNTNTNARLSNLRHLVPIIVPHQVPQDSHSQLSVDSFIFLCLAWLCFKT